MSTGCDAKDQIQFYCVREFLVMHWILSGPLPVLYKALLPPVVTAALNSESAGHSVCLVTFVAPHFNFKCKPPCEPLFSPE